MSDIDVVMMAKRVAADWHNAHLNGAEPITTDELRLVTYDDVSGINVIMLSGMGANYGRRYEISYDDVRELTYLVVYELTHRTFVPNENS